MKVEYDVTMDDLFVYHEEIAFKGGRNKTLWLVAARNAAVLALAVGAYSMLDTGLFTFSALLAGLIFAWGVPLFRWFEGRKFASGVRRLYADAEDPALGRHSLEIDETGLTISAGAFISAIAWEGIRRVRVTRSHIFVLFGSIRGAVLPVRSLTVDASAVVNALRERVAPDLFEDARGA